MKSVLFFKESSPGHLECIKEHSHFLVGRPGNEVLTAPKIVIVPRCTYPPHGLAFFAPCKSPPGQRSYISLFSSFSDNPTFVDPTLLYPILAHIMIGVGQNV